MFERYTEPARRALFFSRYEAAQLGGLTIEPEHLALGVLREAPDVIPSHPRGQSAEMIRAALAPALAQAENVSASVEIPFSPQTRAALQHAAVEADGLDHQFIGPSHVILGILVKTDGPAAQALGAAGLDAKQIREHLRTHPEPVRHDRHAAGSYRPGMVVRLWKGVVKPGLADDYVGHLKTRTFPALRELDGHVGASILRRDVEDGTEFVVTTVWRSLEAIRGFAGDDLTAAVVPPPARAMMVRCDERAVHYEIVQ